MTGIVTDDEQTCDPERRYQGGKDLDPPRFDHQQTGNRHTQNQPIEQKPNDRRGDARLYRKGLQQFLKPKTRFVGRQGRRRLNLRSGIFRFGKRRCLHSRPRLHVERSTYYYTPRTVTSTELRQAVSASGHSKTPKCSQASIRAVAASRVLASSRLSWVSSHVSRARRARAEGSLSKRAGKR